MTYRIISQTTIRPEHLITKTELKQRFKFKLLKIIKFPKEYLLDSMLLNIKIQDEEKEIFKEFVDLVAKTLETQDWCELVQNKEVVKIWKNLIDKNIGMSSWGWTKDINRALNYFYNALMATNEELFWQSAEQFFWEIIHVTFSFNWDHICVYQIIVCAELQNTAIEDLINKELLIQYATTILEQNKLKHNFHFLIKDYVNTHV
jgi:hypothetical protein